MSKQERQQCRQDENCKNYLIAEGNFLQGVIIAIYSAIGLLLFVAIFGALFCYQQRTAEEIQARKGGLFVTDMEPSYQSKIEKPKIDVRRQSTLGRLVQDITTE